MFNLAIMSLDPTGTGRRRWSNRWKKALNAFEIPFDGRLSAGPPVIPSRSNHTDPWECHVHRPVVKALTYGVV